MQTSRFDTSALTCIGVKHYSYHSFWHLELLIFIFLAKIIKLLYLLSKYTREPRLN